MTAATAPAEAQELPESQPVVGENQPPESDQAPPEPTREPAQLPSAEEPKPETAVAPRGFLSIDPTQDKLRPDQRASLRAINIDPDTYDIAQIRVFIHFCQVRHLDPYAKEAYLLKYGNNYSIVTSIDTYRRKAFATGRYRRKVAVYWTGAADDPNSWVVDTESRVRYRVWDDVWLRQENPAAAKVVIEYYDERGDVVQSHAVANWEMFVATKWKDGKKVPNEMWTTGGPHQLAKCAEALALRQAFPTTLSGFFVQEEMEHVQSESNAQYLQNLVQQRQESFAKAQATKVDHGGHTVEGTIVGKSADAAPDTGPAGGDAKQERTWLFEELDEQARILGQSRARLTTRHVAAHRCNAEDLPVEAVRQLVLSLRPVAAHAAEVRGATDLAAAYQVLPAAGHAGARDLLRSVPSAGGSADGASEPAD
ncbi:recombinase RecT [Micromonospora arborensis]|uniref:recombinase RecT n=1 Tax=Micromonospora arborensis TaxID=2116518 RepID=UPI0033F0D2C0